MLIALGFLAATLVALLIAPAFWARAVRLTSSRIKDSMPLSEVEIRADKDRIRAEYAIRVHKLESLVEQVRLAAARQQIELNRRDASINEFEGALDRLKASHEETQNARRVLEQTVADRLPRVEGRLSEAKQLLFTRDREIGELTRMAEKHRSALAEAASINAQQQAEIERLETSLATRAARNQEGTSDPRFDGEVALRAELGALRAKTREQAQLLVRMQSLAGNPSMRPHVDIAAFNGAAAGGDGGAEGEAAREQAQAVAQRATELERQVRMLKARNEDQAGEINRLKAALAVFEGEADRDGHHSLKESRIALKARLQSLEAQTTQQTDVIHRLRSELAAANERLARQATHFTAELKRLGAGTLPASGQARRASGPARLSLSERVAQARIGATQPPAKEEADKSSNGTAGANGHGASPHDAAATAKPAEGAAPAAEPAAKPQEPPAASPGRRGLLDRIASLSRH
jgi:uncharacterized coiled-coil protein SlyX